MPLVSIPVDQSLLDLAKDVAVAMQRAGYSEHPSDPEHVLASAINIGLEKMRQVWIEKTGKQA